MGHRQPILTRNPDERDASPVHGHFCCLLDSLFRPGGFNGNIYTPAIRPLHDRFDRIRGGSTNDGSAEAFRELKAPWKPVRDKDLACAGKPHCLQNEESNGARSENGNPISKAQVRQIRGVQGHPQRLQKSTAGIVYAIRNGKTLAGRDNHLFPVAAILGVQAAELQMEAKVRISLFALFTPPACRCRVNSHPRTRPKRLSFAIQRIRPYFQYLPGKLVPEDQRFFHHRVPDSPVLIRVKVTTADAGSGNTHQRLPPAGFWQIRQGVDTKITRPVKANG
jgi:hypothetical protein